MPAFTAPNGRQEAQGSRDWEISPDWRTSYSSVSWSYGGPGDPTDERKTQRPQYRGSLFYKLELRARKGRSSSRDARCDTDGSLNVELAGIQGALDALMSYEKDAGFHYEVFPGIEQSQLDAFVTTDLSGDDVEEAETRIHKERWNEFFEDLMRTPPAETPDTDDSSDVEGIDLLQYSTSTLSSIDLSSSEGSIDSLGLPATPKARTLSSYHHVEIKGGSPSGSINGGSDYHSLSPGRSLNASASSFIPNFASHLANSDEAVQFPSLQDAPSHSKSQSFTSFTFPSLNPPASAPATGSAARPKKDNLGPAAEDVSTTTPALLPPFLQQPTQRSTRARKSRTREIVDRLRSEASPNEDVSSASANIRTAVSPKYASYCPSPLPPPDDTPSVIQPRRTVSEDGSGDHLHRLTLSTTSFSASASASASTSVSASNSGLTTPDVVEEEGGWIDVSKPTKEEKAKRTRELFLALTKRRTDSLSSEQWKEIVHNAGAKVENEDLPLESSISSLPSPPKTPPQPINYDWNTGSPLNSEVYSTGWVESSPVGTSEGQLPYVAKSQKEKTPRKDAHHKKKSSAHSHNHNHAHTHSNSFWARGPPGNAQHTMPHLQHHPHPHVHGQSHVHAHVHVHQHQHHNQHQHIPIASFPPTTSPSYATQPLMPHAAAPSNAYYYPGYPTVGMPAGIAMPVAAPSVGYTSAPYGVMPGSTGYAMSTPHSGAVYTASPSGSATGGYAHMRGKPVNAGVASMPMPVPVGAGYAGLGSTRGKGTW